MLNPLPVSFLVPKPPTSDARRRIDSFLRRSKGGVGGGVGEVVVEPLVQEAGERVYFRIRPREGRACGWAEAAGGTIVLCVMAEPYEPGTLPFANSTLLYEKLGVRAPAILEDAPDIGVVALEDLGDDLLQTVALRGGADVRELYDEAIGIIVRIQREGARVAATPDAARFRAYSIRLDGALFLRELRFFSRHLLRDYAGIRLTGPADTELESRFAALAEEAAGGPQALAHRDFHSRNLIALPDSPDESVSPAGRLHVIDHQDSRIGPRAYDLMSLVRDPYVAADGEPFMPFTEQELVLRFREAAGVRGNPDELLSEFDAVGLQRNLKALGTYGFQIAQRRNEVYRRYLAPTLRMVRENLDRHHDRPDRRSLRSVLEDIPDP